VSALPSQPEASDSSLLPSNLFDGGEPTVAILLSTFNGEEYLIEQLESIQAQSYPNWKIYASDDGSSDNTMDILKAFSQKLGNHRMEIFSGPRSGFAQNFLSLLRRDIVVADYYAFCDQLLEALKWLSLQNADKPLIYCGRTHLVNQQGILIGKSPLFARPPALANALVQSIAGGNTMVLNHQSRNLLAKVPPGTEVPTHDWWAYLVVTACGGICHYDPQPHILYRQHLGNLIGSGQGILARLKRYVSACGGSFERWTDANIAAIESLKDDVTIESAKVIASYVQAKRAGFFMRIVLLYRSGVYRQNIKGNIGLLLLACVGKL
jgi:glycosyltransferase involved in cell wall biosynthesis